MILLTAARVSTRSEEGNGHYTVGASQQENLPAGCLFRSETSRHKFNPNLDSAVECSVGEQCFCAGDCAPIAAHVDPESVATDPGTSGTGGTGAGGPAVVPGPGAILCNDHLEVAADADEPVSGEPS
jgi:hypothetical protein